MSADREFLLGDMGSTGGRSGHDWQAVAWKWLRDRHMCTKQTFKAGRVTAVRAGIRGRLGHTRNLSENGKWKFSRPLGITVIGDYAHPPLC